MSKRDRKEAEEFVGLMRETLQDVVPMLQPAADTIDPLGIGMPFVESKENGSSVVGIAVDETMKTVATKPINDAGGR